MKSKGGSRGRQRGKPGEAQKRPAQPKTQGKDLLFILDIGTRSVIGVAGRLQGEMLKVLCVESEEHSQRAVVDGQIQDIEQTAKIAGVVKDRMEKKLGLIFQEVHVAAAGRVLKTERAVCEMELDDQNPIAAKELAALGEEAPLCRFGRPEEVAQLALSLAAAPAYLTGQVITIDGGWYT